MADRRSGALAYLDANVFIELVEGALELVEQASALLRIGQGRDGLFATSELTLAEVLAGAKVSPRERRLYMNLIVWSPAITLVPVSRYILMETADLRKYTSHKLPDAIHVVSALRQNCRFIVSRDKDMKKLPAGMISRLDIGPEAVRVLEDALNDL
jgi:predicted nucleic acid-binding protein